MKRILYLAALVLALAAGACSDTEQFRVNGTIKGKPSHNLRVGYYADGVFHSQITAAREGEFEFFASSSQPAVLEITDYEYRPLGRLYVVNGETYTIEIDPADPYAVKAGGSPVNERWSAFLRDKADALRADANTAVPRTSAQIPPMWYPRCCCSTPTIPRARLWRPTLCLPPLRLRPVRRPSPKATYICCSVW